MVNRKSLNNTAMIPRWYQQAAIDSVLFAWEEFRKVLLHSSTGSGKNFMAAKLIEAVYPARCLFAGDQDELVSQPLDAINRFAGIIAAVEKAKNHAPLTAKVIVGSVQTLARKKRLERFPEDFFDFIIVDEAHRMVDQKERIFSYFHKAKVCGLSATPFRSNLRDLSKWYDEVAFSMPMLNLIDDGFAPPLKVLTIPVEIDLAGVETKKGFEGKDYDAESLSTTIAPYYEKIVALLREHAENRHTIVFLPLIKSSEAFAAIARAAGIQAIHVDGNSPDRDEILEGFRRGRYQMLCNANVVETGVDIPIADCFVNLRPTRSAVRYQQGVGRILRVLPGVIDDIPGKHQAAERRERIAASAKPDALIIDFLWQHDELGVMRPGHLVAANEDDARAMFEKVKQQRTPEDLQRIAKLVQEEREALVVKRLEEVATRTSSRTIEPAAFGYLIGSDSLMKYEPVARWEMEKPSTAQLEKLAKWGIDVSKVTGKGMASKLMDALIHRFKFRLATMNQLRALAKLNVQFDPRRLSLKEASRLISETKISAMR